MTWYVYLIECIDRSIYTGITNDVAARYAAHACGRGARYTRSHPPLRLLATVSYPDRSAAARAEWAVKQLTAARKRALAEALAAVDVAPSPPVGAPVPARKNASGSSRRASAAGR